MNHDDVYEGMWVKYWDTNKKKYYVAQVIDTVDNIDEHGYESKSVLIADPVIKGAVLSIGSYHLQPYRKYVRETHCWGKSCNATLNSGTMPLCEKCNGIICPTCSGCLCRNF